MRRAALGLLAACCWWAVLAAPASAQNRVTIDATAPVPAPVPVAASLGASRNPQGVVLGVNSQYLTLDGKPWLPVMGEFHYSRYPEAQWEQELLKMKAAGINIVSVYVIWIHHAQNEGQFDFSGQRDLKRFVELCGRHGLYVVVRVGPWVHAEVRNGGFPDWVLRNGPVRQNDPVYLREVDSYFKAVGSQLHGQLWKDGGPVIGVQIENEYNLTGPGKGMEHIRTLKAAVIAAGLDVPLYTVTGWDGAAIPLDAVLPVFGGYPDAPWAGTSKPMPANEIYAFRFNNRAAGSMGAIGGEGQNSASTYSGTPFLTAEVGDGIEDTYFRRPVVSADDVAAIVPVMLGSGVNLLGYYMFHGGRNPDGGAITLQESQRTGYPTDVPLRSYDFQAPLGEFGQERESLRKLKLVHYFLNDFGSSLATMAPRAPSVVPESPSDASWPRVAARTLGEHGFVFFNNHVRSLAMPHRPGFQVELQLPSGTLRVPQEPIDLPADAYGIWPVNLDIGSSVLRYSTAQIFKRVVQGAQTSYWFFAIPGVVPEVLLAPRTEVLTTSPGVRRSETPEGVRLRAPSNSEATVRLAGGVTLVILPEVHAEQVWRVDDPSMLLLTAADALSDGRNWTLMFDGKPQVPFGVFGAGNAPRAPGVNLRPGQHELVFQQFVAEVPSVVLKAQVTKGKEASLRAPWTMGPAFAWRSQPVPLAPEDHDFEGAAEWTIHLPKITWAPTLSDVFVRVDYAGDEARLYQNGKILDDNFWNGLPFTTGWRELTDSISDLRLRILPLPQSYPMYIEQATRLHFDGGVVGKLEDVQLVPQYKIVLEQPEGR